jgi:uncharacterized protein YbjT (DUF2867 family)
MILLVGATGRLLPVTDALLARGLPVRLTARDPRSARARALARRGAEVVQADLDDPDGLTAAVDGAEAVFAAGSPHQAGPDGERRHGINVARAVAAAGTAHLVFSSGAGAERPTGVPVLDGKHAVEREIARLGIPSTILAPVYFMENAFNPWNLPALAAGRFPLPLPGDRPLQQIAIADLASVAVAVLERPADFAGERLALAGDELTGEEAAAALTRVAARSFEFQEVPLASFPEGMRLLFDWLRRGGPEVDVEAVRRRFPDIGWHRFADWAGSRPEFGAARDHAPGTAR